MSTEELFIRNCEVELEGVSEINNVDKTIDALCSWIQRDLGSESCTEKSVLAEMVNALANLVSSRYQPEQHD